MRVEASLPVITIKKIIDTIKGFFFMDYFDDVHLECLEFQCFLFYLR